jgi:hypothetical protein
LPSLPELQRAFAGGVFDDAAPALALFESTAACFEVYRHSVLENYRAALAALYPVARRLTGDRFFDRAAARFARQHPSRSGDLHRYGGGFPAFLESYTPARDLPYLADVARLEWHWHCAFHAADPVAPALDRLATVAPADHPRLVFQLQPGCRLLRSPYPVHRIWAHNQPEHADPEPVRLDEGAACLIICREDTRVSIMPASPASYLLADAMLRGLPLGEAAGEVLAADGDADIGAALKWLVAGGIIAACRLADERPAAPAAQSPG